MSNDTVITSLKEKIDDLNQQAWEVRVTDLPKAFELSQESVKLARSINYPIGLAEGLRSLGFSYVRFFKNDEEHQLKLITAIRTYQPEIVLGNALHDRHPDHGRAGQLIEISCFLSGLMKIETAGADGKRQDKWRPKYVLHYLQDWYHEPQIIMDISDVFDQRMKAIEAYSTQFYNADTSGDGEQTYISSPDFLESVIARARMLGKKIGVKFGEGFTSEKQIGLKNLDALIQIET